MATTEQVRHYQALAEEAAHGSLVDAWRRIEYMERQRLEESANRGYVVSDGRVVRDVWGDAR
jgi:hypothetical protein